MSFRTSRARKLWTLLRVRGIRSGIRAAVDLWARDRLSAPPDVLSTYGFVLAEECPAQLPLPQHGTLKINWIVPAFGQASGGMFNILRAVLVLEQWGHTNRIYVAQGASTSEAMVTDIARSYFPIKAEVKLLQDQLADSDALIATSWPTAYAARSIGNTSGKFYFVQDLEHLFHAPGSLNEFARETYRWGFLGITAGQWISDVLQAEFQMKCCSFSFSYDRDSYSPSGPKRLQGTRKRVLFYARPSTERRGFELGVLALSLVAQAMPDIEFVLVGLRPRSIELPFPNLMLGILSPSELGSLYRSCTVSLVLSFTNLSLLPLELMASGCAIVSNSGPNVEWLLNENVAQLVQATPRALAGAILALLRDEELRTRQVAAGIALAQATDWNEEIRSIEAALYQGLDDSKVTAHE